MCCPDAPHLALGLCSVHYQRRKAWKRGVKSTTPEELEWLDGIVEAEKVAKKERAAHNYLERRKEANNRRRVDKGYRKYTTKYRYGVTQEYIDALREKQRGLCVICGVGGQLYIDHCHTTSKVRGLLCPGCNTMVGVIEKRGHLLQKAYDYIEARGTGTDDRPTKTD
jgi:hypothetical protein